MPGCVVADAIAFDDELSVQDELACSGLFAEVLTSRCSALHMCYDNTFDATVSARLIGDNGQAERCSAMNRNPEVFVLAQVAGLGHYVVDADLYLAVGHAADDVDRIGLGEEDVHVGFTVPLAAIVAVGL